MTRSTALIALLLASATLLPARAQSHAADNIINGAPLDYPSNLPYDGPHQGARNPVTNLPPAPIYSPPAGWTAARTPNPAYPLRITLACTARDTYSGAVHGQGTVLLQGAKAATLNFRYACVLDLDSNTLYQARWIKLDHKLQVLLADPRGHNFTCRLSTSTT